MRTRQLIAFMAVAALLFAMTSYAAHFHHPDAKAGETTHCDLCIQFASTGGPSAPPKLIVSISLIVVGREPPAGTDNLISFELPSSHRSRAPPVAA